MTNRAEIVVCGAGIAGIATAYHLAVRHHVRGVVLIDEREPLSLTSDKGTQGYRNWWPGPDDTMLRHVSRSIGIMEEMAEESNNVFRLNRRGYVFVTATDEGVNDLRTSAQQVAAFGMGPLREHSGSASYVPAPPEGFRDQPVGADLLLGDDARRAFPFLSPSTRGALHVRRAGWMNAVALGAWMFERAIGNGVTFVRDRVSAIDAPGGRVSGVRLASGAAIETNRVVLAAGPMLPDAGRMLGVEWPLLHELHAKVRFSDHRGAIPRSAPFVIWNDPTRLAYSDHERQSLAGDAARRHLSEQFPGGVHLRPVDGPRGDELWLIWTYTTEAFAATWPPPFDPFYEEICLRGLAAMLPAMSAYVGDAGHGIVDGGYYCKAPDNRPLIGPLPVQGAFVIGGLSGSGIMSSHAAAEMVAAHLTNGALPDYAGAFLPSRFDDAAYLKKVAQWGSQVGQL